MYKGHSDDVTGDLCRDLPGSSPTSRLAGLGSRCRSLEAATPAYIICATHISVYRMLPYLNIFLVYRTIVQHIGSTGGCVNYPLY